MSQLHHCNNGTPVTDQVILYQQTRDNDDFIPIYEHYESYKEVWFRQLCDYLDRESFNSEYDYKLARAVDLFDEKKARALSKKFNWSLLGMFNRWFYHILSNWKSNIKASSMRLKNRPSVLCPVCGRWVGKISAEHLQHYKGTRDLPKYVIYNEEIFATTLIPLGKVVSFGKYSRKKMISLNQGRVFGKKKKGWPWKLPNGKSGVFCPLTKKIVSEITDDYIKSLPDKLNRYSTPYAWETFIEEFPNTLIQADIYSLDKQIDAELSFGDQVPKDWKIRATGLDLNIEQIREIDREDLLKYENVFYFIDQYIEDTTDREIMKLLAVGYAAEDISSELNIAKAEVRDRIAAIRKLSQDLKNCLLETK